MNENPYAAPKANSIKTNNAGASGLSRGVYVEGDFLVCPVNTKLPKRCIKTNQDLSSDSDVQGKKFKKSLYWCPPWVLLTFLIAGLITLILYFVMRKKLDIEYYLCEETAAKYSKMKTILLIIFLGSIAAMFVVSAEIIVILVFVALIALILLGFNSNHFSIRKFDNNKFYIKGCHRDFLAYIDELNSQ